MAKRSVKTTRATHKTAAGRGGRKAAAKGSTSA